ncbi:2'-5' RNA ligase family protein [Janibacter melonis]|uniref:2'-5' RNA ligase family protein n=1 Tax=Janibacter melonis TaxID=262209 RepID=A0A5P8FN45_9MICO|nr:2'-5' RNA ligase family protein [Janibacter melonis]QFQ30986.2 2'-5' RNA ligase family protein [Janibacter melonis]
MGTSDTSTDGHLVLVVPVPQLEDFVLERTRHYDDSFVSTDAAFVHAHITLLAPWVVAPTAADLAVVAEVASRTSPVDFVLDEVGVFPDGTIYLGPDPAAPFASLTAALVAAFPQCPPYGGRFDPVPHLTVDHVAGGVTVGSTRSALGPTLPARCRAERISLQRYANHGCRTVAEWELGA